MGPFDLTGDLGIAGCFQDHRYGDAIRTVEAETLAAGKILAGAPHPGYSIVELLKRGYRMIIAASDTVILRDGLVQQASRVKEVAID